MSLEDFLQKNKIQLHDLEYILNFLNKEGISPQLAMRRIKLFEKIQDKMEKENTSDKVQELSTELDMLSKVVEELQNEKEILAKEKDELSKAIEDSRLQQDLFNAEREELKQQMNMLMDSMGALSCDDEEVDSGLIKSENQELKRKIGVMTAGCQTIIDKMGSLEANTPALKDFCGKLKASLETVREGREIPKDTPFEVPKFDTAPKALKVVETPFEDTTEEQTEEEDAVTISADQIKFVKKVPAPLPKEEDIPTKEESKPISKRPVIQERLFVEPEELEESKKEESKKEEPKKEEPKPKKVDVNVSPVKESKSELPAKKVKILNLFLDYVAQADSDETFKIRVSAICDMDEAYIELGGLAMSQIYSYQTKSLKEKKEFDRLLKSWMENGLPS